LVDIFGIAANGRAASAYDLQPLGERSDGSDAPHGTKPCLYESRHAFGAVGGMGQVEFGVVVAGAEFLEVPQESSDFPTYGSRTIRASDETTEIGNESGRLAFTRSVQGRSDEVVGTLTDPPRRTLSFPPDEPQVLDEVEVAALVDPAVFFGNRRQPMAAVSDNRPYPRHFVLREALVEHRAP